MSAREIVTLQIGHYSNFVGAHWWNLQESSFVYDPKVLAEYPKEINHDILFREGRTIKGDITFTPRLVLFDLNNSLGTLKKEGALYETPGEENIKWLGDVTLHEAACAKKNSFLQDLNDFGEIDDNDRAEETEMKRHKREDIDTDEIDRSEPSTSSKSEDTVFRHGIYNLDDEVEVWSDYLRTGLHPRSTFLLKDHQHNNPEQPFNIFGVGQQVAADREQWDAIEDKIRYFTEECDLLQGFHILLDSHNAFGGLATSILTYLSDEFSNKSRFSFAVTPACPPDETPTDRSSRILNSALSLYYNSDHSSLYVPLSLASSLWRNIGSPVEFPNLQYNATLDYHTSAILAVSLDTATMPHRKETGATRINDITSSFSSRGRKVSALNMGLPFPLRVGSNFTESLMGYGENDPWVSLTPHVKCSSSPAFHSCVVRGIPSNMVKSQTLPGGGPRLLSACRSAEDVLRLYLSETYPGSLSAGSIVRDGVRVGAPFPHVFSPKVNYQGFITDTVRPQYTGVETSPAITSLQSSNDVHSYIDSLEGCVSRFNIARHQHFIEAGLEPDDFTEAVHGLKALAQCYKENTDF